MRKAKHQVPFVNIGLLAEEEYQDLEPIIRDVLFSGKYVSSDWIDKLERRLADYLGVKEVILLNSGTDALVLSLLMGGVKPGDEVITAPNSFIASTAAIVHLRAHPVFVDVLPDQNIDPEKIRKAITRKTKAIMPIHLTGRSCEMDQIMDIAKEYGLLVIEDAAQAIGTRYKGKPVGTIGDFGCFSAHPLKNLNAIGDGGYITTNDPDAGERLRRLRSHGMENRETCFEFGYVSRMDAIQAAVLDYRLGRLDGIIERRRQNAETYKLSLNKKHVYFPEAKPGLFDTYHTFVIQVDKRDQLREFLKSHGVKTSIHYPKPIHLQPAAHKLGYKKGDFPITELQSTRILTLPINQYLSEADITHVCNVVNSFFEKSDDL